MTGHPFDSDELGRVDPDLGRVAERLERYAAESRGEPPLGLAGRIRSAVDLEPHPRGPFAALLAHWSGPVRAMGAGAAVVLVVAGAIALGQLVELTRQQVGATPSPTVLPTPTASPTPSPTPTPTPTASPTPSLTSTPAVTHEPSFSEGLETGTPEPAESDGSGNSGPGGGDRSGNSGPGGGDGSGNSGSGGGDEP
jgi:uncharacterized membrane protein YgcG